MKNFIMSVTVGAACGSMFVLLVVALSTFIGRANTRCELEPYLDYANQMCTYREVCREQ